MAVRVKLLFLLAIVAIARAQSDPPPEEPMPERSTEATIDPITELPPPQTAVPEEIVPISSGPIDSPPPSGEPMAGTSEPTPDPATADPTAQPTAMEGVAVPISASAPAEAAPADCPSEYPVYAQRSFLPRPPPPLLDEPASPPSPSNCGVNEIFETLPLTCEPDDTTCDMYFRGEQRICVPGDICSARCRCLPGYYRNRLGECVMPPQCCDDPNSEMVAGPNTCPGGTCACPLFKQCDNVYVPFGCQCKTGFLKMSDDNPLCVPIQTCHLYV